MIPAACKHTPPLGKLVRYANMCLILKWAMECSGSHQGINNSRAVFRTVCQPHWRLRSCHVIYVPCLLLFVLAWCIVVSFLFTSPSPILPFSLALTLALEKPQVKGNLFVWTDDTVNLQLSLAIAVVSHACSLQKTTVGMRKLRCEAVVLSTFVNTYMHRKKISLFRDLKGRMQWTRGPNVQENGCAAKYTY